jgi:hypothetical protein
VAEARCRLGAVATVVDGGRRAELAEVRQFRNVVLLRYALSDRFDQD